MGVAPRWQINWMKTRKMHKNNRRRDGGPRCAWVTCGGQRENILQTPIYMHRNRYTGTHLIGHMQSAQVLCIPSFVYACSKEMQAELYIRTACKYSDTRVSMSTAPRSIVPPRRIIRPHDLAHTTHTHTLTHRT